MSKVTDLKNLPPEERIKRLKKIEEDNKKEIEEAQKMLKDSEDEAEENEELLRKVPIPQIRAVDIDSLFSEEEKDAFATMRFVDRRKAEPKKKAGEQELIQQQTLEQTVAKEKPQISEQELRQQREYFHRMDTVSLQERREEIYGALKDQGYQRERAEEYRLVNQEMEQRRKDAEEGHYKTTSKKVAEILGLHTDDSTSRHYSP